MSKVDTGMRCWCGDKLIGDTETDVWSCEGCDQPEDSCECEASED